jgi:hypothetical protein
MSDAYIQVKVSLALEDPERGPESVNTFHYRVDTVDLLDNLDTIRGSLVTFYGTIQDYLANDLTGDGRIQMYSLTEGETRTPVLDETFTFTPGTSLSLPAEVAVCLSYTGQITSGVNRRRNRGRIYIGPLNVDAGGHVGDVSRPNETFMGVLAGAAGGLKTGAPTQWSIFSRAQAGPPEGGADAYTASQLTGAFREVDRGYVDNAWDTQRRRGAQPTDRVTWGP